MHRLFLATILVLVASVHCLNKVNVWDDFTLTPGEATSAECDGDVFPDKIDSTFASFDIEYKGNYKILTNDHTDKKYVLYQRGCAKPSEANVDGYFQVPLTSVYTRSSSYFNTLEYIGERKAIRAINGAYTSSACLHKQLDDGWTIDANNAHYNETTGKFCKYDWATNGCGEDWPEMDDLHLDGEFHDFLGWTSPTTIDVSDTHEDTFLKISEWNIYLAVFFNREKQIMDFSTDMRSRWVCNSANAESVSTKKTVLVLDKLFDDWGPTWPEGYKVASCVQGKAQYRYCELVMGAGAEPLNADVSYLTDKGYTTDAQGEILGITAEDIRGYAKDVDVIFFRNTYCQEQDVAKCEKQYGDVLEELKGIKAVDNEQIYDDGRIIDPLGGVGVKEGGHLEPDVLLEDLMRVVYPTANPDHDLVWLRNMITEGHGSAHPCTSHPEREGCKPTDDELAATCKHEETHVLVNDGCAPITPGDEGAASSLVASAGLLFAGLCAALFAPRA